MTPRLQDFPQITKLAKDLNVKARKDPVTDILYHCETRFQELIAGADDLDTLSDRLGWVASKLRTEFRMVLSDNHLFSIQQEFLDRNEKAFVNLRRDLSQDVFGITYKLQNSEEWSYQYVSVIDCRGAKKARSYFTKWHEIAHLLTLTPQTRSIFRRTHRLPSVQEPEEQLMDRIAAKLGFYAPIFHKAIENEISFDEIERLRAELCPEASWQASLINFVKYWPTPCVYVKAEVAFNKKIKDDSAQRSFDFMHFPEPILKSFQAFPNDAAKKSGLLIFDDTKVPPDSVLFRMLRGDLEYAEAEESLRRWNGRSKNVKIKARVNAGIIEAFILPV